MNAFEFIKELKRNNFSNVPLGNIFVEEFINIDENTYHDRVENYYKRIAEFNTNNKWYLPFDVVTYLQLVNVDSDDGTKPVIAAVTFHNNNEHKLTSTIQFSCIVGDIGVVRGKFAIRKVSDIDSAYVDSLNEQARVDDILFDVVDIKIPERKSIITHALLISFDSVVYKSAKTGKIVRRVFKFVDIYDKELRKFLSQYLSTLTIGFGYFTNMLIDPNVIVVEEKIAQKVKNVVKTFPKQQSVFRVMNIKTVRSQYIKHNGNGSGNKLEIGHERCRHTRTFRSDYYKNRKGETIIIEPTWVGPIESYDPEKKRLYKVHLDLLKPDNVKE